MDLDAKPLLSPSLNPHLILTPICTKINNKEKNLVKLFHLQIMALPTPPPHRQPRWHHNPYPVPNNHPPPQSPPRHQLPMPYHQSDPIPYQNNWVLIMRGCVRPIGDVLVRWPQQCPQLFWRQIEAVMEQSLCDQIPQLPPSTQFGRIIVNLTTDLAIISPTMTL